MIDEVGVFEARPEDRLSQVSSPFLLPLWPLCVELAACWGLLRVFRVLAGLAILFCISHSALTLAGGWCRCSPPSARGT